MDRRVKRNRRLPIVVAVAASVAVLLAASLPVSAAQIKGGGLYARFGPSTATDVRGFVVVDRANSDSPPVNVDLLGLMPMEQVTINFRSIGCGGEPARANRIGRVRGTADEHGDLFIRKMSSDRDWAAVSSVWINQGESPACRPAVHFQTLNRDIVGDWDSDGAIAAAQTGDGQVLGNLLFLLERRSNDRARLSIAVNGLDGNDDLRLRLVDEPCGTAGDTVESVVFQDVMISGFRSVIVGLTGAEIDKSYSVRARTLSGNNTWCGPLSLIIVVV